MIRLRDTAKWTSHLVWHWHGKATLAEMRAAVAEGGKPLFIDGQLHLIFGTSSTENEIGRLLDRYGVFTRDAIVQAIEMFGATRKRKKISTSLVLKTLLSWTSFPIAAVEKGVNVFLTLEPGRQNERYCTGIIRSEAAKMDSSPGICKSTESPMPAMLSDQTVDAWVEDTRQREHKQLVEEGYEEKTIDRLGVEAWHNFQQKEQTE